MSNKKISCVHYPDYRAGNPYQELLAKSLNNYNINTAFIKNNIKSLFKHSLIGNEKILHLHWIDGPITSHKNITDLLYQLTLFYLALTIWKIRKKKVIWTMHNLSNHENKLPNIDRLNTKIIAMLSNKIIIHSQNGALLARDRFKIKRNKCVVCYHGNYVDCINYTKPKKPNGVNFLYFGRIRKYKGVTDLIRDFKLLDGPHKLHICGKPHNVEIQKEILFHSKDDSRITLDLSFIPEEKLEKLLSWCHITVIPYKDIFTSGSVLMSLSAGRAIISPKCGQIPEYVDDSCSILYDPSDQSGLIKSMRKASKIADFTKLSNNALNQAKSFDWDKITSLIAEIYIN